MVTILMLLVVSALEAPQARADDDVLSGLMVRFDEALRLHATGASAAATNAFVEVDAELSLLHVRTGRLPETFPGFTALHERATRVVQDFVVPFEFECGKGPKGWSDHGPWACGIGTYAFLLGLADRVDEACKVLGCGVMPCSCEASAYLRCWRLASAILMRQGRYREALAALERQDYMPFNGAPLDRDDVYFVCHGYLCEREGQQAGAAQAYGWAVDFAPGTEAAHLSRARLEQMGLYVQPTLAHLETYLDSPQFSTAAILAIGRNRFAGSYEAIVRQCDGMTLGASVRALRELNDQRTTALFEQWSDWFGCRLTVAEEHF